MIGIVILNWNGWQDTIACLESVIAAADVDTRVVVVDNASTDDSVARLDAWAQRAAVSFVNAAPGDRLPAVPAVTLVRAPTNGGFAAGNNVGLRFLLDHGGCDLYWLLNNDAVIAPTALSALVRYTDAHRDVGLIGSTIAEFDRRDLVQCAGGAYYDRWLTLNRAGHQGQPLAAMEDAPDPRMNYICGAAMLIRSSVVASVGLLNEDYFLYYEEIDYARRASVHGFRLGWCRDAVVYHKGGATTGGNRRHTPRKSVLAEYHANLSYLKFTRRYDRSVFPVSSATRFVLKAGHHLLHKQWHLLPAMVDAYVDYFRGTARR